MPEISLRSPSACSDDELHEFELRVREGFDGSDAELPRRIREAQRLAFQRDGKGTLVAIAALKRPTAARREHIFAAATAGVASSDYPLDLGWVYVLPPLRGRGIARALCRALVESEAGARMFSSTREDNAPMRAILGSLGFGAVGRPYPRPERGEMLQLHLRRWPVERIDASALDEVVDVLAAAFHEYPVKRYILGAEGDYEARLRILVRFFAMARVLREEPILGVREQGVLCSVGLVSDPTRREWPSQLAEERQRTFARLGEGARLRYERFGAIAGQFHRDEPHVHLNMIGVAPAMQSHGAGRAILDAVHAMSRDDPRSSGVSLSTEHPANLPLYEHFGYEVFGEAPVEDAFTTWALFRPERRIAGSRAS